jgi:uncharacterized membrane protein (DUF485 family)
MANKLENLIGVIVLFFILIVIYVAFATPLMQIYENVRTITNETGTNYSLVNEQLSKYPMIFGFFCVCFGIAIIVVYVVNAHRKEYEEYPDEPRE